MLRSDGEQCASETLSCLAVSGMSQRKGSALSVLPVSVSSVSVGLSTIDLLETDLARRGRCSQPQAVQVEVVKRDVRIGAERGVRPGIENRTHRRFF